MLRGYLLTASLLLVSASAAAQELSTWWAYQPLARPAVPDAKMQGWVRSEIDAFVLAGLESRGLQPAASASRAALLRRLTYDLTGLPPTIEEIAAFEGDRSENALRSRGRSSACLTLNTV